MVQYKKKSNKYGLSVVDGMIDWVRVIDKNNKVLYANKKMREDLGNDMIGSKCYDVFCSSNSCDYCISKKTIQDESVIKKEARIGDKTFMVISSPVHDEYGETVASVEVFRDLTNELTLTKILSEKNKKMSDDISFARNMQIRMLPPKGMYNGLKVDYLYEPSELLSGDFFDVFKIDNKNTGIYICDVVGHGVSASLLTVFVRQSLRTIAKSNMGVNSIMKELHKTFLSLNLEYDKYFSVFLGIYNQEKCTLNYVNAGHNTEPILLREESVITLNSKGYPIANIFDDVQYEEQTIQLNVGDKLYLYTDGITEARNEENIQYGFEKILNRIKNGKNVLGDIKSSLDEHCSIHKDDYAIIEAEII